MTPASPNITAANITHALGPVVAGVWLYSGGAALVVVIDVLRSMAEKSAGDGQHR
jgi:hypothetical protein